jgi:SAM-dependent methyltransferase
MVAAARFLKNSLVIRRLLAAKGVHFIVTRFGPPALRRMAFDEKYRRGDSCFHQDNTRSELAETVRSYLRRGDLLLLGCGSASILGCGSASILDGLEASGLNSALGIDLSPEAIRLAGRFASRKVALQIADIETFACARCYDEILFSESLYYLRPARQLPTLFKLSRNLKPGGVFVVTLADATRYRDIAERIRLNFRMIEDRTLAGSNRQLLVFQPRPMTGALIEDDRQKDTGYPKTGKAVAGHSSYFSSHPCLVSNVSWTGFAYTTRMNRGRCEYERNNCSSTSSVTLALNGLYRYATVASA